MAFMQSCGVKFNMRVNHGVKHSVRYSVHIGRIQKYNKAFDDCTNTVAKLMKFLLAFERTHRVLRAKAAGVIATQDLLDLDIALIAFLAREETAYEPSIRASTTLAKLLR
jgi:hypothetical protein